MKTKLFATIAVAAMLVGGGLAIAQMPAQSPPKSDPRIQKLLDQNEEILKNQEDIKAQLSDIKDTLADLKESILILKRRSS